MRTRVWVADGSASSNFKIQEFEITVDGSSAFLDPFDATGGTPPPAGPNTNSDYSTIGTFTAADESGDKLSLVLSQGDLLVNFRRIGAQALGQFFDEFITTGSVRAAYDNIEPQFGEGYSIGVRPEEAGLENVSLRVVQDDDGLRAVFEDETGELADTPLSGLTGSGTIGLRLDLVGATGVVTPMIDTGSGFSNPFGTTSTISDLSSNTYTGGFLAAEVIPEPGTVLLLGSGLAGLGLWGLRRREG